MRICIVLPAYNEGSAIGVVVKGIKKTFSNAKLDHKIVVVDDGSTDSTAKVARSAGAFVISHLINVGSGGATATGLSYARQKGFDIAVTLDADGQHDPKDALKGVKEMAGSNYDLLIGSRLIDSKGMSWIKKVGNSGLTLVTFLLFRVNITDSQSGLRVFSKRALDELKWKTTGYEYCSEMLWRAKQKKLLLGEFPIKAIYTEYSKAKGQNSWNAFNIIKTLLYRRLTELINE